MHKPINLIPTGRPKDGTLHQAPTVTEKVVLHERGDRRFEGIPSEDREREHHIVLVSWTSRKPRALEGEQRSRREDVGSILAGAQSASNGRRDIRDIVCGQVELVTTVRQISHFPVPTKRIAIAVKRRSAPINKARSCGPYCHPINRRYGGWPTPSEYVMVSPKISDKTNQTSAKKN